MSIYYIVYRYNTKNQLNKKITYTFPVFLLGASQNFTDDNKHEDKQLCLYFLCVLGASSCHPKRQHTSRKMRKCRYIEALSNFKVFVKYILFGAFFLTFIYQKDAKFSSMKCGTIRSQKEECVIELLHMHSGTGYFVTSLPTLLVLSSGCPNESRCKSIIMSLNSASGREEFIKYRSICLLLGVMVFLCPA